MAWCGTVVGSKIPVSRGGDGDGIGKGSAVFDDPAGLIARAQDYIDACAADSAGAKGRGRFPNLAGFCRFLGVGVDTFLREMAGFPEEHDIICAMLEDEALNSELAVTLLSTYLKKRLGYDDKADVKRATCEAGELKLVFEHDIFEDGG